MQINNLYNFKNSVRHFLNIDSVKLPLDVTNYPLENLCWVEPIKFRVKKQNDKYRTLRMPNILNFACAYEQYKNLNDFTYIKTIDPNHKRLAANISTGDFVTGEYRKQLENDFERLCIYDNLIRVDIKNYYGRVYTHKIDYSGKNERYLSNLNLGATNGLIMGNYLSLYFAETYLKKISNDLKNQFMEVKIDCEFTYFSDDFYFYCNKNDNDQIIKIFDNVLEKYDLERNENKLEFWTYESFNNYNIVERSWKKLIAHCNTKFKSELTNNKLHFINQLIYRMHNLADSKLKTVFINNFFKTKYFQELETNKYEVRSYDYHQLCFIFKFSPEAMLYAVDKLDKIGSFDNSKLHKFLKVRYNESLNEAYNEEQLYFYFAVKLLGFDDILLETKDSVLKSDNQILISYYLKDGLFDKDDIDNLKRSTDECYWFQNYHLILYTDLSADLDSNIKTYLVPKNANKENKVKSYLEFYRQNIQDRIPLIRDIDKVNLDVKSYLMLKIGESEAAFEAQKESKSQTEVEEVDLDLDLDLPFLINGDE